MMIVIVAVAGCAGAVCRYLCSLWINQRLKGSFPFATLLINAVGCLLIGLWYGTYETQLMSLTIWKLVSLGFLGAFTTFSTFSVETMVLYKKSKGSAFVYLFSSFIVAFLFAIAGYSIIT